MGLAHSQELDDQGLPLLDLELDLLVRLGSEEERRRGQDRGVRIGSLVGGQIGEDTRIEHVAERIARRGGAAQKGRGLLTGCVQVGRWQVGQAGR